MAELSLDARFIRNLRSLGVGEAPLHLLVAFSGGLDSTVLLHLLRYRGEEMSVRLSAAHLDHGMRPSSAGDASWVRGLCEAWGIPLEAGVAAEPLRSEQDARTARYEFLRAAAARVSADRILTAHHADDQAETVLFRILRGTGLPGLGGIPRRTEDGLLRPLLPFWREELEEYAADHGLSWRTDPTNATHGPARNKLRLTILPQLEREVAHSARRNLVSLAALARESETGWRRVIGPLYEQLVRAEEGSLVIDRKGLREQEQAIATRLVRKALRQFGMVPDRLGTRSMLTFITDAPSGREMQLTGGLRLRTEFDHVRLERDETPPLDETLTIEELDTGGVSGEIRLAGKRYRVDARPANRRAGSDAGQARWSARIPIRQEQLPLELRARRPADRMRTQAGSKSLKKLLIEQRVPVRDRARRPILVDSGGSVLWVAGLDVPVEASTANGEVVLEVAIRDV